MFYTGSFFERSTNGKENEEYSFDKMFAVIIFIVIISLLLLLAVNIVSRITMPWLQVEKEKNHE